MSATPCGVFCNASLVLHYATVLTARVLRRHMKALLLWLLPLQERARHIMFGVTISRITNPLP
jgi:hypothetical protein